MARVVYKNISSLSLNLENPRYKDPASDEKEAIYWNVIDDTDGFEEIIESLHNRSYVPSEGIVMLVKGEDNKFVVYDGNRRISAMKLLLGKVKVNEKIKKELGKTALSYISNGWPHQDKTVPCEIVSLSDALDIMEKKHTKRGKAKQSDWDTIQRIRFMKKKKREKNETPSVSEQREIHELDILESFLRSHFLGEQLQEDEVAIIKFERKFPFAVFDEAFMPKYLKAVKLDVSQLAEMYPDRMEEDDRLAFETLLLNLGQGKITTQIARDFNEEEAWWSVYTVNIKPINYKKKTEEPPPTPPKPPTTPTPPPPKTKPPKKKDADADAKKICTEWVRLAREQGGARGQKMERLLNEIGSLAFANYPFSVAFLLRCCIELSVKCFCEREAIDLAKYNTKSTKIIDFKLRDCLIDLEKTLAISWFKNKSVTANNVKELERAMKFINGESLEAFGFIGELNDAIHRDAYTPPADSLRAACTNINILMRLFLNDNLN